MSYTIIEIANTHGGSKDYLNRLIDKFSIYHGNFGMKFQPLHPDKLATPNFQWYPVYQKLVFTSSEWSSFIMKAAETKDVWLDLFDDYGIEILKNNIQLVFGIKLQVSVLYNLNLIKALSQIDLSNKKLILNVAALTIDEIDEHLKYFEKNTNANEILLEVGFQGYPTELGDSGISKINIVKNKFNKRIVFADHIDAEIDYAIWLPALAISSGADIIEKHVMLSEPTEYDKYSSLTPDKFAKMMEVLNNYNNLTSANFINDREREYLKKSILKPIINKNKFIGQAFSVFEDLDYRRSDLSGLNGMEVKSLLANFHILSNSKNAGDTLKKVDFKKANIAVIIAGRLKSSRLKEKALLKIGNLSSVETCIKNACEFKNVNHVILATSDLESDSELVNHTYKENVIFHKGHPEDVIQRYLDIIRNLKIDVIIRITADMPFVDDEICQLLLKSHFENGADYTAAKEAAVGTNLEIINVQALEKVKSHFPSADYSEYMTWYFMNNQEHFRINLVDLPDYLVRDYRMTLDYEEDLVMFNHLFENLADKENYNLKDLYSILDNKPEIANLNSHIKLKYKTDKELIDILNKKTKI
jgi:spore coat polysaccharide biosynthesis protein SpsF (cytidylyltransferase family)/sialic acid synthase SpsE